MVVAWAIGGVEAAGPRVDRTPTCPGGGRARPSLLGGVGRRVMQDLAGSSGISPELRIRVGSFSLGSHLSPHPTLFTVLVMHVVYRCIDIYMYDQALRKSRCLPLYYSLYMYE